MTDRDAPGHERAGPHTWSPLSEIEQITATIRASERLCLLGAVTLSECAAKDEQQFVFVPSISRTQQNRDVVADGGSAEHVTTAAQCVAALQKLVPVVGRFQIAVQESKELPFHHIEPGALRYLEPRQVQKQLRGTANRSLERLDRASSIPESPTFGRLHPFTAAHFLRVVATSRDIYRPVWWNSMLTVLWFLHLRRGSVGDQPNAASSGCPSTAFLTGKCIDALEIVLDVFQRRRKRFQRLLQSLRKLQDVETQRALVRQLAAQGVLSEELFDAGYRFQGENLVHAIRAHLRELCLDNSLPKMYAAWNKDAGLQVEPPDPLEFGAIICKALASAITGSEFRSEAETLEGAAKDNLETAKSTRDRIAALHAAVDALKKDGRAATVSGAARDGLPEWICNEDYWTSTQCAVFENKQYPPEVYDALERHWRRQHEACAASVEVLEEFNGYLTGVLNMFRKFGTSDAAHPAGLTELFGKRDQDIHNVESRTEAVARTGAEWARILMERELARASSSAMIEPDAGELAQAARVVCRISPDVRFEVILGALHTVCKAQKTNGTWDCRQPFRWDAVGKVSYPLSVETALSVVSTAAMLLSNPERFGASREEVAHGLEPVFEAVDRFFRWLAGSIQSFPKPPALRDGSQEADQQQLYGWCSERAYEPGRIHSWFAAAAIEFLVAFREIQQQRINSMLRAEFVSHLPGENKPLSELEPTDLEPLADGGAAQPVTGRLLHLLEPHKLLQLSEGPWLPDPIEVLEISFWSAILHGPPGSSKTTLAKAIAAELGWPLISLSPADFLARGSQGIEARSQEIFEALTAGSRIVYFFDEIDELIRDRMDTSVGARSVFSFLTPSFLTKLQDFRDAAKKNEFVFIIGTNYFERIDSAAKRSGRIDENFPVIYPDLPARAYLLLNHILPRAEEAQDYTNKILEDRLKAWNASVSGTVQKGSAMQFLDMFAEFGGLLSYSNLRQLNAQLRAQIRNGTQDLAKIRDEMRRIRQGRHDRFKSEINLADYATRGRGALAEAGRIAMVIPRSPMPWLDDGVAPRLDFRAQWKEYLEKFNADDERGKLEAEFCEVTWGDVQSMIRRPPTQTH